MRDRNSRTTYSRREFLVTTRGRRRRHDATGRAGSGGSEVHAIRRHEPPGQKMLASYAKAVEAMLKLPADDPHNWFRNAFIHLMDCPHGNWWFYVWHRGFMGYFETTIRKYSGDDNFAFPYWDWTNLPRVTGLDVRRRADARLQSVRALQRAAWRRSPRSSNRR